MAKKRQEALKLMKKELSEEHLSKKYGTIWRENFAARKLLHANDEKLKEVENQEKKHRTRGGKRGRSKSERAPRVSGSSQDGTGDGSEKTSDGPGDNKVRIRKKIRKKISVKRIKPKLDKNNSL